MKIINRYEDKTIRETQAEAKNAAYFNAGKAYKLAKEWEHDYPVIDTAIWAEDAKETAKEFKDQGCETVAYMYEGSNAWDTLKIFQDEGFTIQGMTQIIPIDDEFPNRKQKPRNGLLLKLQ